MKVILTESFIYKMFYIHIGLIGFLAAFFILQKIFLCLQRCLEIVCAVLIIAICSSGFAVCSLFLCFCYIKHDIRIFSAFIFFIIYLLRCIRTLKTIKREGLRGLAK